MFNSLCFFPQSSLSLPSVLSDLLFVCINARHVDTKYGLQSAEEMGARNALFSSFYSNILRSSILILSRIMISIVNFSVASAYISTFVFAYLHTTPLKRKQTLPRKLVNYLQENAYFLQTGEFCPPVLEVLRESSLHV